MTKKRYGLIAAALWMAVVGAHAQAPAGPRQTIRAGLDAVVDPTRAQFSPSVDQTQSTKNPDGSFVLSNYVLVIRPAGGTTATWTVDLGKPTPDADGLIRAEFASKLTNPPAYAGVSYEGYVLAVGPGGSSQSNVFGTFSFSAQPPAPPATSPDFTLEPPALRIVDAAHSVWTIGPAPAYNILKDGSWDAAGKGQGPQIYWSGGSIYVFGINNAGWFKWNGTSWDYMQTAVPPNYPPPGGPTTPNVDCQFTTSCTAWSACTAAGQQTRTCTITITQQASGTGQACPTVLSRTETQACTPPPAPLAITCPPNMTVPSPNGQPVAVTYPLPVVAGGTPPYVTDETPVSGSSFSVGSSIVTGGVSDAAGKTAACSFTVSVTYTPPPTVDTTPPTATITSVVQSGNSSNYAFYVSAKDNVKVAKVLAWLDSTALPTRTTSGVTVAVNWAVTVARGTHTLKVQAQDAAGNLSPVVSRTFIRN